MSITADKDIFSAATLEIDCEKEVELILTGIRSILRSDLKRRGIVVGVSGGIDMAAPA